MDSGLLRMISKFGVDRMISTERISCPSSLDRIDKLCDKLSFWGERRSRLFQILLTLL